MGSALDIIKNRGNSSVGSSSTGGGVSALSIIQQYGNKQAPTQQPTATVKPVSTPTKAPKQPSIYENISSQIGNIVTKLSNGLNVTLAKAKPVISPIADNQTPEFKKDTAPSKIGLQPDFSPSVQSSSALITPKAQQKITKSVDTVKNTLKELGIIVNQGVLDPVMTAFPSIKKPLTAILERAGNTPVSPIGLTPKMMENFTFPGEKELAKLPLSIKLGIPVLNAAEQTANTIRFVGNLSGLNPTIANLIMAIAPEVTTMVGKALLKRYGNEAVSFIANKDLILKATRGVDDLTPKEAKAWKILNETGLEAEAGRAKGGISVTDISPKKGAMWDLLRKIFPDGFTPEGTPTPELPNMLQGQIDDMAEQLAKTEYSPGEVIDMVSNSPLKNTPDGKELIKAAVKAQQTGENIIIGADVVKPPTEGLNNANSPENIKWFSGLQDDMEKLNRGKFIESLPRDKTGKLTVDPKKEISKMLDGFNKKYGTQITTEDFINGNLPERNDLLLKRLGYVEPKSSTGGEIIKDYKIVDRIKEKQLNREPQTNQTAIQDGIIMDHDIFPDAKSIRRISEAEAAVKFPGIYSKTSRLITLKDGSELLSDAYIYNGKINLDEFSVAEKYQRKGIGTRYITELKKIADKLGYEIEVGRITGSSDQWWRKVLDPTGTSEYTTMRRYKPKKFTYTPSTTLTPEKQAIEAKFASEIEKDLPGMMQKYEEKFGKVINTDNFRELSPDYEANRQENSAAVHEPASELAKLKYKQELAKPIEKDSENLVLFTAGGTGSGKTTAIQKTEDGKQLWDSAQIIYDTNLNSAPSAIKKIDQALEAGRRVGIAFVYRDPIEAFENGVIPRTERIGRTVPIESHIETHMGMQRSISELMEHYKNNPNVEFTGFDNTKGKGNQEIVPIENLLGKVYNEAELRKGIYDTLNKAYQQGKVTEAAYKGFTGENPPEKINAGDSKRNVAEPPDTRREEPRIGQESNVFKAGDVAKERLETLKNTPPTEGTPEPPGPLPPGKGISRLQERLQEQLLDMDPAKYSFDPQTTTYDKIALETNAGAALDLLEKNPQKALRIARGLDPYPATTKEGATGNSISLAVALKALDEGNIPLFNEVVNKTTLRSSRFGQEIVSLRGQFNDNTPQNYIKRVLDARLDDLGKSLVSDAQKELGLKRGTKAKAAEKIDREVEKLSARMKVEKSRIQMAQDVIDSLICK